MTDDLSKNSRLRLALPMGRVRLPKFLYIILFVLGILVLIVNGLNFYLKNLKKPDINNVLIINRDSIDNFSSTYSEVQDDELPIKKDFLLNPMLSDWSVLLEGVIVNKSEDSFTLENKIEGYKDTSIEIKKCPDSEDILFKIFKEGLQVGSMNLVQLGVGLSVNGSGRIFESQDGNWGVCGNNFIINEH